MKTDERILSEIKRYNSINNYIMEQDALDAPDLGAEPTPAPDLGGAPADAPVATPADTKPQIIDVKTDTDVQKIDNKGESEETDSSTEELDITDLVDSQKKIESKQEEYFQNLFGQLENLQSKLGEMDSIMNKLNSLESKIEKYREKTPQERLELRTLDSYPFNQKLSTFFDDKQEDMEKTGKHEYVLTSDEVEDINTSDIKGSFQPGGGDSYDNEFKR